MIVYLSCEYFNLKTFHTRFHHLKKINNPYSPFRFLFQNVWKYNL